MFSYVTRAGQSLARRHARCALVQYTPQIGASVRSKRHLCGRGVGVGWDVFVACGVGTGGDGVAPLRGVGVAVPKTADVGVGDALPFEEVDDVAVGKMDGIGVASGGPPTTTAPDELTGFELPSKCCIVC